MQYTIQPITKYANLARVRRCIAVYNSNTNTVTIYDMLLGNAYRLSQTLVLPSFTEKAVIVYHVDADEVFVFPDPLNVSITETEIIVNESSFTTSKYAIFEIPKSTELILQT